MGATEWLSGVGWRKEREKQGRPKTAVTQKERKQQSEEGKQQRREREPTEWGKAHRSTEREDKKPREMPQRVVVKSGDGIGGDPAERGAQNQQEVVRIRSA